MVKKKYFWIQSRSEEMCTTISTVRIFPYCYAGSDGVLGKIAVDFAVRSKRSLRYSSITRQSLSLSIEKNKNSRQLFPIPVDSSLHSSTHTHTHTQSGLHVQWLRSFCRVLSQPYAYERPVNGLFKRYRVPSECRPLFSNESTGTVLSP